MCLSCWKHASEQSQWKEREQLREGTECLENIPLSTHLWHSSALSCKPWPPEIKESKFPGIFWQTELSNATLDFWHYKWNSWSLRLSRSCITLRSNPWPLREHAQFLMHPVWTSHRPEQLMFLETELDLLPPQLAMRWTSWVQDSQTHMSQSKVDHANDTTTSFLLQCRIYKKGWGGRDKWVR